MERRNAVWSPAALLLASLAACTAFDPRVGASQDTCGAGLEGNGLMSGSNGYGATATSASGSSMGGSTLACTPPDGGSACDVCESTYCCMTRIACYRDPVCACADQAMDSCVASLSQDASPPSAQQIDGCRDAFAARGTVEAARIACQEAWCATACVVP